MNKVNIYGGLGNQMFQFSFMNMLDSKGFPSRISVRDFFLYNHHNGFELDRAFDIELAPLDRFKLKLLEAGSFLWANWLVNKVLALSFTVYSKFFERTFKEKREFNYDPDVFRESNIRYIGTWQSVNYFPQDPSFVKNLFRFKTPTDPINSALAGEIQTSNAVAVHVRRGDYTSPAWRSSHLVIDGPDYYRSAIGELSVKYHDLSFYFFSDDMDWVKRNFHAPNFTYVDHNLGPSSYLDMYLMSLCSKFIIPNSTFSWWAAWLSDHPDKEVYMPDPWIRGLKNPEIYPSNVIVKNI